ncbi:MAG TPA: ComF family protein [Syntrophorhabdaceae bacterium]
MPDVLRLLLDILYPLKCGGCGAHGSVLCRECVEGFRVVEEASTCPVCGRWMGTRAVCGECITHKRGFQEGFYGFYFENRLRDALHSFKFEKRKDVGRLLVALIKDKVASFSGRFDTIIPIPVTEKRLKARGFNQSFVIGEEISRITGLPVAPGILVKTQETLDQYSLSKTERRKNIKGVFSVLDRACIEGKRVLLVDDLFTTGYTMKEAAQALKKEKAGDVAVFALARTGS